MPSHDFGTTPDGRPVRRHVVGGEPGLELHLLDLGATVHRLVVTGGDGVRRDVALGHPTLDDRLAADAYIGATVGRYANRIAAGRFPLDGTDVQVGTNDRGNALHGGPEGFDRRVWDVVEASDDAVTLQLVSPDGDQGFPGEVTARATFAVSGTTMTVTYEATTDAPTPVCLTQHLYLNLDGGADGTLDGHELSVAASRFTPVDDTGIPVGGPAPVDGTPFDLREPRRLGPVLRSGHEQLLASRGIDHNLVLDGEGLREVAVLRSARTRTAMTLATDQPGLQVYTGNFLDGSVVSLDGGRYRQGDGIAMEPQLFPDTPNRPEFGDATLRPGERYTWTSSWRFDAWDPDGPSGT